VQLEDLSTVDLLLDKDGDDLMEQRLAEHEMFHMAAVTRAKAICEIKEPHIKEANAMVLRVVQIRAALLMRTGSGSETESDTGGVSLGAGSTWRVETRGEDPSLS
jgi:hypothetical protein